MNDGARQATALDRAGLAMEAAPEDEAARLAFWGLFADAELCLLLEREAQGARLSPRVFELADGPVVLAFDGEDRLAAFAGGPAPYAALPGRVVAQMLAGQGIGLGLNLDVSAAATLLPGAAMDWLAGTLAALPGAAAPAGEGLPLRAGPPALPPELAAALAARLAPAVAAGVEARLASVGYAGGREGHLLAVIGAGPGARGAIARAVAEALLFAGLPPEALDLAFADAGDPAAALMRRAGVALGPATAPEPEAPKGPGMDPARPPVLR